jgi:hypothetical protein
MTAPFGSTPPWRFGSPSSLRPSSCSASRSRARAPRPRRPRPRPMRPPPARTTVALKGFASSLVVVVAAVRCFRRPATAAPAKQSSRAKSRCCTDCSPWTTPRMRNHPRTREKMLITKRPIAPQLPKPMTTTRRLTNHALRRLAWAGFSVPPTKQDLGRRGGFWRGSAVFESPCRESIPTKIRRRECFERVEGPSPWSCSGGCASEQKMCHGHRRFDSRPKTHATTDDINDERRREHFFEFADVIGRTTFRNSVLARSGFISLQRPRAPAFKRQRLRGATKRYPNLSSSNWCDHSL